MVERLSLTDYKILNYLLEHDIQNYNKMSEKVGIPASTIYDRIKSMRRKGFLLRLAPVLDLEALGYRVFAALEVEVHNMRDVDRLKDSLVGNPNVVGLFKMSGNYDLLVLALFKSPTELEELISGLLKRDEVKDVHGNLSIHSYKFSSNPSALKED